MVAIAYIAVSLDGYIADSNGGVEWLENIPNPDGSDYGFADFMASIDALLMGANTFRVVQSFGEWPYEKPVFVASRSITAVPPGYENRITLVQGEISDILAMLQASGYQRIYVDGGQMIQSCLQAGLLNELVLTQIPLLLGNGIPLFRPTDQSLMLEHQATEVLGVGLVKSHYRIKA